MNSGSEDDFVGYKIDTIGAGVDKSGLKGDLGGEPDADSIKLFIGQIPREMTENELRAIFEPFGPIYQIVLVKDRNSGEYKGCAFLIFYKRQSAIDAQNALHGKKSFPGLKGLMQVKPANSEIKNEEERRIFVGMLPKTYGDEELREMMLPFGALEDCVILRDREGTSKGCAFVTYATKRSAANAIKALNQSKTLEGSRMPIVVKLAETPQQKELKQRAKEGSSFVQNPYMPPMMNPGMMGLGSAGSGYANQYQSQITNSSSLLGNQNAAQNSMNILSAVAGNPALVNPSLQNLGSALSAIASDPVLNAFLNPNMALIQQLSGTGNNAAAPMLSGNQQTTQGMYGAQQGYSVPPVMQSTQTGVGQVSTWKNPGLEGCNLFVFNIPEHFRENELMQLFSPFGNVVSCRAYVDKKTNKSKGFGFVTYDQPSSASSAIQAMNGAHVGNRRIKVEIKKPRVEGKPY